jgi:hypothetical protein
MTRENRIVADLKLIQAIANVATRNIERKYPFLQVNLFVIKDWSEMRLFIGEKHDTSSKTGHLYDLGEITPPNEPLVINEVVALLESRIEPHVKGFLKTNVE